MSALLSATDFDLMNTTNPGVVAAYDGSSASRKALDWAAEEAVVRGCDLTVLDLSTGGSGEGFVAGLPSQPLPAVGERLALRAPQLLAHRLVVTRADDMRLTAALAAAQLLVLGARCRRGTLAVSLGSVSEELVRRSRSAIAVVPEHAPESVPLRGLVLLGADRRHGAADALTLALFEADVRRAALEVLYAAEPVSAYADPGEEPGSLWFDLLMAMQPQVPDWPEVRVSPVITRRSLADALADRSREADAVILGSTGRLGLSGLSHDATECELVSRSHAPVIFATKVPRPGGTSGTYQVGNRGAALALPTRRSRVRTR